MMEWLSQNIQYPKEAVDGKIEAVSYTHLDVYKRQLRQAAQQCATACQGDAVLRHIGVELRRCTLERLEDSALNLDDRLVEALSDLLIGDTDLSWQ